MRLIFIVLIFSFNAFSNSECGLQKINDVNNAILEQIEQIEIVLSKKEGSFNYPVEKIFGVDYDIQKNNIYIKELERLNETDGVNENYSSFFSCLVKNQKKKESALLSENLKKLNELKIELFRKNQALEDTFRQGLLSSKGLPKLQRDIETARKVTEIEKNELQNSLVVPKKTDDVENVDYSIYFEKLTKAKIELLEKKIEYSKNLEEKLDYFYTTSKEILKIADKIGSNQKSIEKDFDLIENSWLRITKNNFKQLVKTNINFHFVTIPLIPSQLEGINEKKYNEIKLKRREILEIREKTINELTLKKNEEIKLLNQLVFQVNQVRNNLFEKVNNGFIFKRIFSEKGFKIIKNEIISTPFRLVSFFYIKYFYIVEKVANGRKGILSLVTDVFRYLFLGLIFILLKQLINKTINYLNIKNVNISRRYHQYKLVQFYTFYWNKIKDIIPSFLWIIILSFVGDIKSLDSISLIIDILEIYFISKIIVSFVTLFLSSVSRVDARNFLSFKKKANITSQKFRNIYLFYAIIMLLVKVTVGPAYLYKIINVSIGIYLFFQVMKHSVIWEDELEQFMEKKFSGVIVNNLFKFINFFPKKLKSLFLLVFIIVLSIFNFLVKITENFEISKKVSANLFKKQIENIEAHDGADKEIPLEYLDKFSLSSLANEDEYVEFDTKIQNLVYEELSDWVEEKSEEHTLVIFGDKGVGKTTFIKHVTGKCLHEFNEKCELKYVKIPSKTTTKEKLHQFFKEVFSLENDSKTIDFYQLDSQLEKKVIIAIDEVQNVFLSQAGGFEAYHELVDIINLSTQKICWVMSFNRYSWLYLDRAFGRVQFFRNVFELKGWSDEQIKDLIMKRHNNTTFKLSYDLLINATQSQDEIDKFYSIESKFFKLLWEMSRGNPRAALYLWPTALSKRNINTLNVNTPKEPGISNIEKKSDEFMFILSHVLRHENLSINEIEKTTNLPRGIVRNAIKFCLEENFLYKDDRSRYMIEISNQYGVIKHLRKMNFIYGS